MWMSLHTHYVIVSIHLMQAETESRMNKHLKLNVESGLHSDSAVIVVVNRRRYGRALQIAVSIINRMSNQLNAVGHWLWQFCAAPAKATDWM
jgi:hypothetical protein